MFPWSAKHGMARFLGPLPLLLLLAQYGVVLAQTPSNSTQTEPFGYANKVTPSMAIIIVVLIAALFFMGFFSIYIRNCADSTSSPGNGRGALGTAVGRGSLRGAARGLDASVIETLPMMQYAEVKGHKIGKGALECAVCLNEFEDHERLRLIPKCDHVFHPECIDAWLASHVTCPVCRANLTPQPGDNNADPSATVELAESTHHPETDLEAQNEAAGAAEGENCNEPTEQNENVEAQEPEVIRVERTLNRNRTPGSRSGRTRGWWFPRSHSTGHSVVQPGENTERFTLRLPEEVRKQIMSRQLDRTMSLVALPRERSSRRGFRTSGINEGSSRGKYHSRPEKLGEPASKSDRRVFARNPSFLSRASSFLTRASSSIIRSGSVRSPKVAANYGEGTSARPDVNESNRPPV